MKRKKRGPAVEFRATDDVIARLDRIARAFEETHLPGGRVYRTQAALAAVLAGLKVIEAEYGLSPLAPATPARRAGRRGAP